MKPVRSWFLALVFALGGAAHAQQHRRVDVITVDAHVVSGFLHRYLQLGLERATRDKAECLVVELDTPGGLLTSEHEITKAILNADVPVVVFVFPSGARAGSAGVFITYAAHIAAMAPMTRIGAAHVVSSTGSADKTMMEKLTNDAAKGLVAIAERRHRNKQWAEAAVRESVSATAEEAMKLKAIDLLANDLPDLLRKIDGRQVRLASRIVTIHTAHAEVRRLPMNFVQTWFSRFLSPEVMMILLLLATYGLIGEMSNPGAILPGVVGVISLILFLALASAIPLNMAGLALLSVGVVMMLAEVKFPAHGALLIGGLVAFTLGALLLFDTPGSAQKLSLRFVIPSALVTAAFFTFVVSKGLKAQRLGAVTGAESMIGLLGIAKTALDPEGQVQVRGEWWNARSQNGAIAAGTKVEVVAMEEFSLIVKPSARDRAPEVR